MNRRPPREREREREGERERPPRFSSSRQTINTISSRHFEKPASGDAYKTTSLNRYGPPNNNDLLNGIAGEWNKTKKQNKNKTRNCAHFFFFFFFFFFKGRDRHSSTLPSPPSLCFRYIKWKRLWDEESTPTTFKNTTLFIKMTFCNGYLHKKWQMRTWK